METPVPSIFGERKKGTLDEQRVYLINACAMLSLVRGSPLPDSIIHEVELLRDVLEECRQRPLLYFRGAQSSGFGFRFSTASVSELKLRLLSRY